MNLPSYLSPARHRAGRFPSRPGVLPRRRALVFAAPLARAQDDPVVARVNGAEISQSDLAVAEEDVGNQSRPDGRRRRSANT